MSTTADVAFAFDTHKFVKQMVATGFTEEQAEAQVRQLSEILHTQLSTKADVAKVDLHVLELKRDIETSKAELQKDIALARVTTIQWTAGMFAAQTALILGALFAVMKMNHSPAQLPIYQPPVQEMRQPAPPPALSVPPAAPAPAQPAR
ncbi:MAG: CCDC90 family protein [Magnetococcus sp. YQC-3]